MALGDDQKDKAVHASRRRRVRVTPALVISAIAVFVTLSSQGYAASIVPLVKRAIVADKAKTANTANVAKVAIDARKLTGQTAESIAAIPGPATDAQTLGGLTAAQIAAMAGPANSLPASLFTYRTESWQLDKEDQVVRVTANCQAGERAIAGGWQQDAGAGYVLQDSPYNNGTGWRFSIWAESGDTLAATGSVGAMCMKVS
jgi:hypothetical protein